MNLYIFERIYWQNNNKITSQNKIKNKQLNIIRKPNELENIRN